MADHDAIHGDVAPEIADTVGELLERHQPAKVRIRGDELHLTFALAGDDGATTTDRLLQLLIIQDALRHAQLAPTGGRPT